MYKWISVWDLLQIPQIKEMFLYDDLIQIYELLHYLGFDIDKDIEVESCYHRNSKNQIVFCPRIIGRERLDDEWMASGQASFEAWKINVGKKDPTMLRHVEEMSIQSNFTGGLVEYLRMYWDIKNSQEDDEDAL